MGALEESAKAAGGVIEALKASPMMLVILLINCAVVGFLFFSEIQQAKRAHDVGELVRTMFDTCLKRTGAQESKDEG